MSTTADTDDKPLADRIADNPRPALVWLAGMFLLVAAELSRYVAGLVRLGDTLLFVFGGVGTVPGWVASNVGGTLGVVAGSVAYWVTIVLMLLLAALVVKPLFVPVSLVDRLGIERSVQQNEIIERLLVAAGVGVFAGLVVLTPLTGLLDAALGAFVGLLDSIAELPSLTSREVISNQGYQDPGGGWEGTFLGLQPRFAWALRLIVIYAYGFILFFWLWRGYITYRDNYREADWSPIDDSIDNLRAHAWGKFGLIVILMFCIMAIWAPAVGPVTAEENIYSPYQHEVEYLSADGAVETATHGQANIDSRSNGGSNVGPNSYDQYGRYAPLGTNPDGKDMLTFLAYGARTSLVIGLIAAGLSAGFALAMAMLTAYYKGLVDITTVLTTDVIQSVPGFLMILLLFIVAREADHPIVTLYDGGILLALILAFVYWPGLWRSIRGPSLQVAEAEWIDAAKSFGQRPTVTMRKHMAPYVFVYLLIYASLILGTIIITTAALSFLGVGITPPTPEWGRMISEGRSFVSTNSWHVATIPGFMIVLVTLGFNAFGDAVRDALDVQTDTGDTGGGAA